MIAFTNVKILLASPSDLVRLMATLHCRLKISIEQHANGNRHSYQLKKGGTVAAVEVPEDPKDAVEDENGICDCVFNKDPTV